MYGPVLAVVTFIMAALVWVKHEANIRRIINRTEPKIGDDKKN
jgi:glycerol-3-phosphate acyltransferase PlsY